VEHTQHQVDLDEMGHLLVGNCPISSRSTLAEGKVSG
jgi:hypothetical protein